MRSVCSKIRHFDLDLIILRYFPYPFNYVNDVVHKHVRRNNYVICSNVIYIICNELEMYDETI